ncbi:MAG: CcoQ/FixQ family Cbb3-type cytochrome c oxidase assembly chaperone [Verrucomicrobiota bacterium]
MIKNVLTHVGGVENFGIISILLFFAVFTGAMIWAASLKKPFLKQMSQLPLEDGTKQTEASHE